MSLRNRFGGVVRRPASVFPRVRPNLEALETRTLLSTYTVDQLTDSTDGVSTGPLSGDLRYCLKTATDGDTINFSVTGAINLTAALPDISKNITIAGPGADLLTLRRDSGGNYRIFTVSASSSFFFFTTTVTISGMTIANGTAASGGGIFNSGNLTLNAVKITGNTATDGGGIYNSINTSGFFGTPSSLTITNSEISGNIATNSGGGIFNKSDTSGGFFFTASGITLTNVTVSGNRAANGGGIANEGTAALDAVTVDGNRAIDTSGFAGGGGLWNKGKLTAQNSTISNNSSFAIAAIGGGIANNEGGEMTLTNCTVAQNLANPSDVFGWVFGGGIYNGAKLDLTNVTVAANSALNGTSGLAMGGGIFNDDGFFSLTPGTVNALNTIIATNIAKDFGPDIFGSLASKGNNLIGLVKDTFGFVSSDILNVDPKLGPLQNNGGPTKTMALLAGSRAIDAGNNNTFNTLQFDQRGTGFARIVNNTIDIGAFEYQGGTGPFLRSAPGGGGAPPVLPPTDTSSGSGTMVDSPAWPADSAPVEQFTPPDSGLADDQSAALIDLGQSSTSWYDPQEDVFAGLGDPLV